jgi:tRNA modification GTPase
MAHTADATIFALSSGRGRAAVAVIRISGPAAQDVLERMAAPRPRPRFAALRRIRSPLTGELLDEGLVLWFPGPRSETGEDMAELHVHGGRAVLEAVLGAIAQVAGCRLAEPGEFARRAFENGKIDLTAAEGLADLIDAETAAQRRQALAQSAGALAERYQAWRHRLAEAMALLEAGIDFSDEADVAADTAQRAVRAVETLRSEIAAHLADGHRGELIRDGFQVVLVGPPNVGKSSLLNALARRDVAIVSAEAGTTRDVIEVRLDLEGLPIVVSDTAGIRKAEGVVEEEGIRRSFGRARAADLVLWLSDARVPAAPGSGPPPGLQAECVLRVANKCDLCAAPSVAPSTEESVAVSATTGFGLERLTRRIAAIARARMGDGEAPAANQALTQALTQARHRLQLESCRAALNAFLAAPIAEVELRAEDLRRAAQAIGRIVGAVDVEDVLDEIFGRFCIGK